MEKIVEIHIPNVLGAEKAAIEKAGHIARKMGFSDDRVEDMKTALSEACINAIEHGNKFDLNTKVGVTLAADDHALKIIVHDEGTGIDPNKIPKQREEENGFPKRRGYGMFLIRNLVNEMSYESKPGEGNEVRMIIHLENNKLARQVS
jgi:serine/threonine-protein kinase RsbW